MLEVRFQAELFSDDVIKRAVYRFSDRFTADIQKQGDEYAVIFQFAIGKSEATKELDIINFKKEVLDQDLRQKIRLETEPVRNLILAHAFSKTGLIADEQISTH